MAAPMMGQAAAPAPASRITTTLLYRNTQANAEGWGVFDCGVREDGTPRIEIQKVGSPNVGSEPRFTDDRQAWQHVLRRAQAGSPLHLQALRLVDPIERFVLEGIFGWWPDP